LQRRLPNDDILLHSRDNHGQVAKLSEIVPKFHVFGPSHFGEKGPPKFLTKFHKSGSPLNTWQSLVTISLATSEIRRRKKEKKDQNISSKTEWPVLTIVTAAIISHQQYELEMRPHQTDRRTDDEAVWTFIVNKRQTFLLLEAEHEDRQHKDHCLARAGECNANHISAR